MSCESSAYFANEVLLTLPTKYYFFVDAVLLLQKYQPPMSFPDFTLSFPDFTRHFFSLLAETVDSVTRAILIHYTQCLAICETRTREGGEVSAFTPLLSCKFVFANAAAVSTTIVTKPQTYQPNIKVMFNQVNQH